MVLFGRVVSAFQHDASNRLPLIKIERYLPSVAVKVQ